MGGGPACTSRRAEGWMTRASRLAACSHSRSQSPIQRHAVRAVRVEMTGGDCEEQRLLGRGVEADLQQRGRSRLFRGAGAQHRQGALTDATRAWSLYSQLQLKLYLR